MRILHLDTEKTWRGGENQVRHLIQGLANLRVEQWAAAPENSVAFIEKRWDCPILPLASSNPLDIRNLFRLRKWILAHKIQLIDAHTAKAHSLALNVSALVPEVKIVVHRRVNNMPSSHFFTRRKYLSENISQFVAISSAIAEVLKKYGVSQDKVSVVKSAVSGETYKQLNRQELRRKFFEKYNLPEKTVIIGNASALSVEKGYQTLLESIAILKNKTQNFQVFIAGEGDQKSSLEQRVKDLGLTQQVHFLGFIKNVPEFLSVLDILAIPSNNEGLGTVILDAIFAGACPVGSRVGGIPEIILHEQTGLLMEPRDSETLSQHLLQLIENPVLKDKLASQARQHIQDKFSLESMVRGNFEVYQKILG